MSFGGVTAVDEAAAGISGKGEWVGAWGSYGGRNRAPEAIEDEFVAESECCRTV